MIFTVPWFPELETLPIDELPSDAIGLLQAVEQIAQTMGIADGRTLVAEVQTQMQLPVETCEKAVWLAEHLGVLARLPPLTTTRRGSA